MSRSKRGWPFSELELDRAGADEKAVKRAYARKLKTLDQASQAAEFQALRMAYETALGIVSNRSGPRRAAVAAEPAPEPMVTLREAAQETGTPDATTSATPEPAAEQARPEEDELAALATDWQAVERLAQRIRSLTPFGAAPGIWREILNDPALVDSDAANLIEGVILGLVMERSIRDGYGGLALPGFVNRELVGMLDERFGWMSDYRLFERKFGHGADHILAALQRRHGGPPAGAAAGLGHGMQSLHWLAQGMLMFLGYVLLRLIVLNSVLP